MLQPQTPLPFLCHSPGLQICCPKKGITCLMNSIQARSDPSSVHNLRLPKATPLSPTEKKTLEGQDMIYSSYIICGITRYRYVYLRTIEKPHLDLRQLHRNFLSLAMLALQHETFQPHVRNIFGRCSPTTVSLLGNQLKQT